MAISPVSFGSNPAQMATTGKKKMDPVKKGAIIGGSVASGIMAVGLGGLSFVAKKADTTLTEMIKTSGLSLGKYAALAAAGIAGYTLIGAGIGKLVKNHQAKKAEKAAALDQQA